MNELNAIMATFSLEKEKSNFNERYETKIEDKQEEIEDRLKEIGIIEEKIRQIKQGQEFEIEVEEKAHQNQLNKLNKAKERFERLSKQLEDAKSDSKVRRPVSS